MLTNDLWQMSGNVIQTLIPIAIAMFGHAMQNSNSY